jgi:ADP-ribose pyrophosphatase
MVRERFKIGTYATIMLRKGDEVLFIKRSNTGVDDGFYCLPGGGIDGNEPVTHAAAREAFEEVGIKIEKENLKVVHVLHRMHQEGYETVGFFVEATNWEGEPQNMEPHKHDDLGWFSINALPENTVPQLMHVLDLVKEGVFFSELGW